MMSKNTDITFKCAFENIEGSYSRTIVCGDIHGCYDEMMELLKSISFCDDDILVCVGDMIDRGPMSWEVANFFRTTPNAYSVLGNHERRVAGIVRGTSSAAWTQEQTLSCLSPDLWDEWAGYFESLPAVIETKHAIITHAQFDPEYEFWNQNHNITSGVMGSGVEIVRDHHGIPSWYHGMAFTKPVCMGHIHYDRVQLVPNQLYALDNNCCFGDKLTAVILPFGEVVSVSAQLNYFESSKKAWFEGRLMKLPPSEFKIDDAIALLKEEEEEEEEGKPSPESICIKNKLSDYIKRIDIEKRVDTLRKNLFEHFGSQPEAGYERGKYFIRLKTSFIKKQCGTLASSIMVSKQFSSIKDFQTILSKKILGDLEELLRQLELELAKIRHDDS
ncbi:MAG: metallophosphoesterase [Mariprofundaceae bacterium]